MNKYIVGIMALALGGCSINSGEFHDFYVTDVSQKQSFIDSSKYLAEVCVSLVLAGELDGPAWIKVSTYPPLCKEGGANIDSIYIPKGVVDTTERRRDFYSYNKIQIEYIPGGAKKGKLKIKSRII